jgi:hypothetical protein
MSMVDDYQQEYERFLAEIQRVGGQQDFLRCDVPVLPKNSVIVDFQ